MTTSPSTSRPSPASTATHPAGTVPGVPSPNGQPPVDREAIRSVEPLIRPYLRRTPVITIDRAELGLPAGPLVLKLEHLQHSGSFKARGAFANMLLRDVPAAGVVAASGGNHGAAVAYAAHTLGIPARIYVPEVSSPAKIARIRGYGADLVVTGASYAEALAESQAWQAGASAMPVHAYDQPETMAGAGTLAAELATQAPGASSVLASVGGGGLLAGIAAWYDRAIPVIGVEPEGAPTLTEALRAGKPVDAPVGSIAVDSLAPRRVGEYTFGVLKRNVAEVILVSDGDIVEAQELLWDRLRLVAEPGGCAALAALVCGRYLPSASDTVAVVLSGANTAAVDFSRH